MGVLLFAALFAIIFVRLLSLAKHHIKINGKKDGQEEDVRIPEEPIRAQQIKNPHN